ncbi:hypothetical protein ASD79_19895 [Caulobacter sp. Root655]|uniref:hypothetical protein n=1 Tax=Caulobacter sp. Root655 TaxID=1736578 RepID=UPI0006FAABC8|nr:hypothetical protein [Caulobacter sp. Root655]KRA64709.1 hypothetical protein ASD79_19895 [Caulobacter sp. Root655]
MLVELDVFSGRPNPRWRLDERNHREFLKLQGRLSPASAASAAPDPPALGYRGFVCADRSGTRRIYKGHVRAPHAVFDDPSFSLERFLLDRLPPEFAPLRSRIVAQLGPSRSR